jgi:hypothetical protein
MIETWKPIPIIPYNEIYEVSSFGKIKRIIGSDRFPAGYILKNCFRHRDKGYMYVDLFYNNKGKHFYIHRLVALAFIPNLNNFKQVNHIDGNKHNNSVENLEWVTAKQNITHACNSGLKYKNKPIKFTKEIIEIIKKEYIPYSNEFGRKALANRYNTHPRYIYDIIRKAC